MSWGILIVLTGGRAELPLGFCEGLRSLGCVAKAARWSRHVVSLLHDWIPDAVILCVSTEDGQALHVLDLIRQHPSTGHAMFFLSSPGPIARGHLPDGVHHFDERELTRYFSAYARINKQFDDTGSALAGRHIHFGWLMLDAGACMITKAALFSQLSGKELALLEYLARRPARVFSRRQLISAIWPCDDHICERTVDVLIMRLRNTLRAAGAEPLVETIHGKRDRVHAARTPAPTATASASCQPRRTRMRTSPWSSLPAAAL